jgi:hypothetical protein
MLKTIREMEAEIIDTLKDNAEFIEVPVDNIEAGRYGELPTVPPAIWVFCEPGEPLEGERDDIPWGIAEISFSFDSKFDALEAAERCKSLFAGDYRFAVNQKIEFDGVFNDLATASLILYFVYKYSI